MHVTIFDTETTGITRTSDPMDPKHSRIVQVSAQTYDYEADTGLFDVAYRLLLKPVHSMTAIVRWPSSVEFPEAAVAVHGITKERSQSVGLTPIAVADLLSEMIAVSDRLVAHNIDFDVSMTVNLFAHACLDSKDLLAVQKFCTMKELTPIMKMKGRFNGSYKPPKLIEAHEYLFGTGFDGAHDAEADTLAAARVYFGLSQCGLARDGRVVSDKGEVKT